MFAHVCLYSTDKAMLENVKKCKNFLSTLIKLAANQPDQTVKNVRALIQGLIVSIILKYSVFFNPQLFAVCY